MGRLFMMSKGARRARPRAPRRARASRRHAAPPVATTTEAITTEDGGPYQAAAVLLATVIGLPADARVLLTALRDAKPGEDIVSFLRDHGGHRLAAPAVAHSVSAS